MQIDAQQAQAIIAIINAVALGVVAIIHAWKRVPNGNGFIPPPTSPIVVETAPVQPPVPKVAGH